MKRAKHNEGQIMIESIVAISIALTALVSALSLVTNSLHYNALANQRLIGSHLAAEGVELVRNMLDRDFAMGAVWGSSLPPSPFQVSYDEPAAITTQNGKALSYNNGTYSYQKVATSINSGFIRDITATKISDANGVYEVSVSSTVRMAGEDPIVIEDHFYNWRQ